MAKYRIERLLSVARALADSNRLRALAALEGGELCVCQMTELLDLAPSTVSKHMSVLRQAGLVQARKEGRWVHYRLPEKPPALVAQAMSWVADSLSETPEILRDRRRLEEILQLEPKVLCQLQRGG